MRFLLSRRWLLFGVAVALLAWLAVQLGQWQFHRLADRQASNEVVAANVHAPPLPVAEVLSLDEGPATEEEWQRVTVHGSWDDTHTVVLKYQTRDSASGVDVVTPLVTEDGTAVLVDRGWMATDNSGAERPETPAVTPGEVTVTGWVRRDATGSATRVSDLSTRALSSTAIGAELPYPVYRGFLDLDRESPRPAAADDGTPALARTELPDDTSDGPHFFYGLQWWFFGGLAVFGFLYLAWDEWRRGGLRGRGADPRRRGASPRSRTTTPG